MPFFRRPQPAVVPDAAAMQAAAVTERAEQHVRQGLEILDAAAINSQGYYAEPFARLVDLQRAINAIECAIRTILGNRWPDEIEAPALRTEPRIRHLRQEYGLTIRDITQKLRRIEAAANMTEDGAERLGQELDRLEAIAERVDEVHRTLYSAGSVPSRH